MQQSNTSPRALIERASGEAGGMRVEGFARPYVVSWNLTYRCNLACEHCYLDAGGTPQVGTETSPIGASSALRNASG